MASVFIHIGLHKTATTSLQRQFFPVCEKLNYLSGGSPAFNTFEREAVTTDPIYYDAERQRDLILPLLHHDMPNLISKESFSGALYAGLIKRNLDHRSPILANLKASLPEAKIILVLRRQDGLARSIYRQYLKFGGTANSSVFYGLSGKSSAMYPLNRFRFSPYVDQIYENFKSGVLVLTFEELLKDQAAFLTKLCEFINIPIPEILLAKSNQTSLGSSGMEFSRILNKYFKSQLNPDGLLPGIPRYRKGRVEFDWPSLILHEHWPFGGSINKTGKLYKVCDEILQSVHDDNKVLDERYNLGLDKYKYY